VEYKLKEIVSVALTLFAIINILGSVPVIIDLRQKVGEIQSGKATLVALILMIAFLFLGEEILNVAGIDIASFAIAGSFIIFFVALEMTVGMTIFKGATFETVSVIPIAFPMIAGAATLSTILTLKSLFAPVNIIIGILLNVILIYAVLKSTARIERSLGTNGLLVLRKAFGILLMAIAIKIFRSNTGL